MIRKSIEPNTIVFNPTYGWGRFQEWLDEDLAWLRTTEIESGQFAWIRFENHYRALHRKHLTEVV